MSETGEAVVSRRVRRDYTVAEKLRMVEATLEPGSSVARVAQANGVNPNLIFVWRKQHREGRLIANRSRNLRKRRYVVLCPNTSRGRFSEASSVRIEL